MRGIYKQLDEEEMKYAIKFLSEMLEKQHGKRVIILIDEYDNTINKAYGKDSLKDILSFLKGFYSSTFKDNPSLNFAVITGVMQIAKESIFSGLNNLFVSNIFSNEFDERYGFTENEVKDMCTYYKVPEKFDEIKDWYDGYRFGNAEIYNPWSIVNYFGRKNFEAKPHWVNTSGNNIINTLLDSASEKTYETLIKLANKETVIANLSETIALSDLTNDDAIFSLMAVSGYLNAKSIKDCGISPYLKCEISIPNKEIFYVFSDLILRRFESGVSIDVVDFFDAIENKNVEKIENTLFKIFSDNVPFIVLSEEKDYELLIAGAALSRMGRYALHIENEIDNGRADIIMKKNRPDLPNIVIEFKKAKSESEMETKLKEGMKQIKEKQYYKGMSGTVYLYSICFHGKVAKVLFEEMKI